MLWRRVAIDLFRIELLVVFRSVQQQVMLSSIPWSHGALTISDACVVDW